MCSEGSRGDLSFKNRLLTTQSCVQAAGHPHQHGLLGGMLNWPLDPVVHDTGTDGRSGVPAEGEWLLRLERSAFLRAKAKTTDRLEFSHIIPVE